jgi:hypothetical protein
MYCILRSDGADSKTMAHFYLAVVQAKLLYGSKTWVLSRHRLGLPDNTWEYPPTLEVLDACSLSTIETTMHTLIVHCTVTASCQLQLGVALIAKCGGISFITA